MNINFSNIRIHHGSQNSGFEELVCQLAHLQKPENGIRFVKKEGAGGDAGVECYWILNDGSEVCWQAKYFPDGMNSSRWQQLDKSYKTALEKHPNLATYIISMPLDKSDSRKRGKGGQQVVSVEDEWNDHVAKWKGIAQKQGRNIEFVYWGKHEITSFLSIDDPLYSGRALYWFNEPVLGFDKFEQIAKKARASTTWRPPSSAGEALTV